MINMNWFRQWSLFSSPTRLEKKLKYKFKNASLLTQALSHKSYSKFSNINSNNERLEYLGDAVLNLVLGDLLMQSHQDADEGYLSKMRSSLVSTKGLYNKSKDLILGRELKMSRGEKMNKGASNPRLLASAFEAIVGAIYLDGGYLQAYRVIQHLFHKNLKTWTDQDYKTILQSKSQKLFQTTPVYELMQEQGPAHRKVFFVKVVLNNKDYGYGEGFTKKDAEQEAARKTLSFSEFDNESDV